jgi:hypothetical protein
MLLLMPWLMCMPCCRCAFTSWMERHLAGCPSPAAAKTVSRSCVTRMQDTGYKAQPQTHYQGSFGVSKWCLNDVTIKRDHHLSRAQAMVLATGAITPSLPLVPIHPTPHFLLQWQSLSKT